MIPVIYSARSDKKVAHMTHCRFVRRIGKEYRRSFPSPNDALVNGYRMCRCCCPSLESMWGRESRKLVPLLKKHRISFSLTDEGASVKTPHSEWLIRQDAASMRLSLYNKNTQRRYNEAPSEIPGYHLQEKSHSDSLRGHLDFILSHDHYRRKHPEAQSIPFGGQNDPGQNGVTVRINGKVYRKNVQLRSEPDLSPWLMGSSREAGGIYKTHFKKKHPHKQRR